MSGTLQTAQWDLSCSTLLGQAQSHVPRCLHRPQTDRFHFGLSQSVDTDLYLCKKIWKKKKALWKQSL